MKWPGRTLVAKWMLVQHGVTPRRVAELPGLPRLAPSRSSAGRTARRREPAGRAAGPPPPSGSQRASSRSPAPGSRGWSSAAPAPPARRGRGLGSPAADWPERRRSLFRPLQRGERSAKRRSAGATMAGLWLSLGSLVAAGQRGRRSPQRLMRSAALWTLKVRRDGGAPAGPGFPGLPAPLRPAVGWAAESAPGAPATPAAPVPRRAGGRGADSRLLRVPRGGRAARRPAAAAAPGSPRAAGPGRQAACCAPSGAPDRSLAVCACTSCAPRLLP